MTGSQCSGRDSEKEKAVATSEHRDTRRAGSEEGICTAAHSEPHTRAPPSPHTRVPTSPPTQASPSPHTHPSTHTRAPASPHTHTHTHPSPYTRSPLTHENIQHRPSVLQNTRVRHVITSMDPAMPSVLRHVSCVPSPGRPAALALPQQYPPSGPERIATSPPARSRLNDSRTESHRMDNFLTARPPASDWSGHRSINNRAQAIPIGQYNSSPEKQHSAEPCVVTALSRRCKEKDPNQPSSSNEQDPQEFRKITDSVFLLSLTCI
ncbi:nuclear receptor corepressor 2-like [Rhincodon typus]|uniref:nuclear receptor corepressor 2-like n=1 Tax=Rhincodon typus TaxID=259920 RepID=UPI00202F7313|nr:nuclear receptor corepressor 2-like [Rhincodon typus]